MLRCVRPFLVAMAVVAIVLPAKAQDRSTETYRSVSYTHLTLPTMVQV